MPRQPVVITGVGIVSAIGTGRESFFESLLNARSGIRSLSERNDGGAKPPTDQEPDGLWIGAPVTDFEPKQYVKPRKALKVMCREIQTAFAAAQLAAQDAGLGEDVPAHDQGAIAPDRLGVVFGSEIFFNPPEELIESILACVDEAGKLHPGRFGGAARREVMPLWMLKYLPNMPACQVGISLNSRGPNNSLVLGDVSGPAAVLESESYLQRGIADMVFAGATGTRLGATRLLYRTDMPTANRNGVAIEDASRPHASDSSGVVGGEAAASLVIESAEHASKRGAKVLAEITATASRFHASKAMETTKRTTEVETPATRASAKAIEASIRAVMGEAAISSKDIGAIISHGLGERQMDAAEATAITVCELTAPAVAVAASIGHAGAASGMMSLATGALVAAECKVPPTRGAGPDRGLNLIQQTQPLAAPYVLCLSHTSDGSAMAVLLKSLR